MAAMSAVNVMQQPWSGSAMLLGADLLHRCWPSAGIADLVARSPFAGATP
jgi:hypothetical protein